MPEITLEEVKEIAKQVAQQAAQAAAQQAAAQAAQQVAEQVAQTVSQSVQKLLQSTGATTTGTNVFTREEMADIGGAERLEKDQMSDSGILFANVKRTYDEYQQESLESIRRNRSYIDKILSDAQQFDNQRQNMANQALQNAIETANMVGKKAIAHGDLAFDRSWNVDEQGYTAASILDAMNSPAVKQVMSSVVTEVLAAMAAKKAV